MSEIFTELNGTNIKEIISLFREIFEGEPWNDDWSDEKQCEEYIRENLNVPNALILPSIATTPYNSQQRRIIRNNALHPIEEDIMQLFNVYFFYNVPECAGIGDPSFKFQELFETIFPDFSKHFDISCSGYITLRLLLVSSISSSASAMLIFFMVYTSIFLFILVYTFFAALSTAFVHNFFTRSKAVLLPLLPALITSNIHKNISENVLNMHIEKVSEMWYNYHEE